MTQTISNYASSSKNAPNPVKIDQQMAKLYFVTVPKTKTGQAQRDKQTKKETKTLILLSRHRA